MGRTKIVNGEVMPLSAAEEAERDAADAAFAAGASEREAAQVRADKREAMRASWDGLPSWLQGPFRHVFTSVNELLDAGKIQAAIDAVSSVQPTEAIEDDATKSATFDAVKLGFIDAINDL